MIKKKIDGGLFIVLEGIDGSGKSALASHLAALLQDNFLVQVTHEPANFDYFSSLLSKTIHEAEKNNCQKDYIMSLYHILRCYHSFNFIIPKLSEGYIVISDRYAPSTFAYGCYEDDPMCSFREKTCKSLSREYKKPDMTFYLRFQFPEGEKILMKRLLLKGENEDIQRLKLVQKAYDRFFRDEDLFLISAEKHTEQMVDFCMRRILGNIMHRDEK